MAFKNRIRLETFTDVNEFVKIAESHHDANIVLTDGNGMKVNGKSLLGAMYSMEFKEIYCESDTEISGSIVKFII